MKTVQTQSAEFAAADNFAKRSNQLSQVPVVDDDYPEYRHYYESALASLLKVMQENGRFEAGNRYGLVPA